MKAPLARSTERPAEANRAGDRLVFTLKLAAPYIAVAVFWLLLHNAWLAILAYHAQILWWSRGRFPRLARPRSTPLAAFVLVSALAGPILYFLLPFVPHVDLSSWLARNGLSGAALVAMVFYYGLVHPFLEQSHWAPLRERTQFAHLAFAGYHVLVLCSLLTSPWLAACFVLLTGASWMWQRMARDSGGLLLPVASHLAADLGIVVVVWILS